MVCKKKIIIQIVALPERYVFPTNKTGGLMIYFTDIQLFSTKAGTTKASK